ncbi:MAG: response regulator [Prochlorothrix sp.]|nr:response regulator [Prochlorothrix sp.]
MPATLGLALLIEGWTYWLDQRSSQRTTLTYLEMTATEVTEHLDDFLKLPHSLITLNRSLLEGRAIAPDNWSALEGQFYHQIQTFNTISALGFTDTEGESVGAGRDPVGFVGQPGEIIVWETLAETEYTRRFFYPSTTLDLLPQPGETRSDRPSTNAPASGASVPDGSASDVDRPDTDRPDTDRPDSAVARSAGPEVEPERPGTDPSVVNLSADRSVLQETPNYNAQQTLSYQIALSYQAQTWTPITQDPEFPLPLMSAVSPVYRQNQLQGVLHVDVLLSELDALLQKVVNHRVGTVILVDRSGVEIASSLEVQPAEPVGEDQAGAEAGEGDTPDRSPARAPGGANLGRTDRANPQASEVLQTLRRRYPRFDQISEPFTVTLNLGPDSIPHWVQVTPYADRYGLDWLILTFTPQTTLPPLDGRLLQHIAGALLITLVGSIGISLWISRRVERPMGLLQQRLESLTQLPPVAPSPQPLSLAASPVSSPAQFSTGSALTVSTFPALSQVIQTLETQVFQERERLRAQVLESLRVLEHVPVGLGLWTPAGELLFLNRIGRQLLGLEVTPSAPLPKHLPPLFYPEGEATPCVLQALPGFDFAAQNNQGVLRNVEIQYQGHRIPLTIKMQWVESGESIADFSDLPRAVSSFLTDPVAATPAPSPDAGLESEAADRPPSAATVLPGYQIAIFEDTTFQRQIETLQNSHQENLQAQLVNLGEEQRLGQLMLQNLLDQMQICLVQMDMDSQFQITLRSVSPQSQSVLGYGPEELQANPQLWYQNINPDDRVHIVDPHLQSTAWIVPGSSPLSSAAAAATPSARDRNLWVRSRLDSARSALGNGAGNPPEGAAGQAGATESMGADRAGFMPEQIPDSAESQAEFQVPESASGARLAAVRGPNKRMPAPIYRFQRPDGLSVWLLSRYCSQWQPSRQQWRITLFVMDVTALKAPVVAPSSARGTDAASVLSPAASAGAVPDMAGALDVAKAPDAAVALGTAALQAQREFLATLSHEMRTALTSISGMADLALQTELNAKQHHYCHRIQDVSQNLLSLLNNLLDVSKLEAGKLVLETSLFSTQDLISRLTDFKVLKHQKPDLELVVDFASTMPPYLKGDALRLGQVLSNLVSNALKFTEQGEVVVAGEVVDRTDRDLTLQFSVRDTGIGLTPEQQRTLFLAFQQSDVATARLYGGTGLGLYICHRLVQQMGGSLNVQSEPGRGSLFWFTVVMEAVDPQNYPPQEPVSQVLQARRVLVVDDSPVALEVIDRLLKGYGAGTTLATSGIQAIDQLKIAQGEQRQFDLILLDQRMPKMDGLAVADYLQRHPDLKGPGLVVMMTGYGTDEVEVPAKARGVSALLTKPIQSTQLLRTLQEVLSQAATGRSSALQPSFVPSLASGGSVSERARARNAELGSADLGPSQPQFPASPLSAAPPRILVVEDNPINQELTLALLQNLQLDADVVENGAQALQQLEKRRYSLILMDCQMPVMDGFEATSHIRQSPHWRSLPIVAMTANVLRGDREKCLAAGMDDYLPKPIDSQAFKEMLQRWLSVRDSEVAGAGEVAGSAAGLRSSAPTSAPAPAGTVPAVPLVSSGSAPDRAAIPAEDGARGSDSDVSPEVRLGATAGSGLTPDTATTLPRLTDDGIPEAASPEAASPEAVPEAASPEVTSSEAASPEVANPEATSPATAPRSGNWNRTVPRSIPDLLSSMTVVDVGTDERETIMSEFRELSHANLTQALERLGHNQPLYCKLLNRFLERYKTFAQDFQQHQKTIDTDPLGPTRLAHTLKGNAATLGFEDLHQLAYELEQSCRHLAVQVAQSAEAAQGTDAPTAPETLEAEQIQVEQSLDALVQELAPILAEVQTWHDRVSETDSPA